MEDIQINGDPDNNTSLQISQAEFESLQGQEHQAILIQELDVYLGNE